MWINAELITAYFKRICYTFVAIRINDMYDTFVNNSNFYYFHAQFIAFRYYF